MSVAGRFSPWAVVLVVRAVETVCEVNRFPSPCSSSELSPDDLLMPVDKEDDCDDCAMVLVEVLGKFVMGSSRDEELGCDAGAGADV